jgi:hypothetical protein
MKNIHVIPTDKPSRFFITNEDEYGFREHYAPDTMQTIKCMNIHITSDEEIKVGDWFIHPDSSCFDKECKEVSIGGYEILQVIKVDGNFIYHSAMMAIHKNKNIKKIILTTGQDLIKDGVQAIDDEFLEWFVKNQACENVYVHKEYKQINQDNPITVGSTTLVFSHYETVIPKEEPKDVLLGYKTSLVAQMLDSKEISEEPIEETLEDAAEKFVNNTRLQNRKVLFMEGAKWQQEQILNFLYEEITERRPYSASKMCEKVIEFIKKQEENK